MYTNNAENRPKTGGNGGIGETGNASSKPDASSPHTTPHTKWVTQEQLRGVAEDIARGLSENQALARRGILPADWKSACIRDPRFGAELDRARAEWIASAVRRVEEGAQGWQGVAWMLERRYPDEWNRHAPIRPERVAKAKPESSQSVDSATLDGMARVAREAFAQRRQAGPPGPAGAGNAPDSDVQGGNSKFSSSPDGLSFSN